MKNTEGGGMVLRYFRQEVVQICTPDSRNKTKQPHSTHTHTGLDRNSNHWLKSSASIGSQDKLSSLGGYPSWPNLLKFLSSPWNWHFTRILIKSHTSVPSEVKWEMSVILFANRRCSSSLVPKIPRKEIKALRRSLQLLIWKLSRTSKGQNTAALPHFMPVAYTTQKVSLSLSLLQGIWNQSCRVFPLKE